MTIGIAAWGANAGLAIITALQAIEKISSGAIGGFVSAVATDGPIIQRAETQRGGVSNLRVAGTRSTFESAPLAALISSGPDRPEPLASFVAARSGVGLVSGHRMPNARGQDGTPLNVAVLVRMAEGATPRAAIESVLGENPTADTGLIALNVRGDGFAANTVTVDQRPDAGYASVERNGARVLVLHNAITPSETLAALTAELVLDMLAPRNRICGSVRLRAGCPVRIGDKPCIVANTNGEVIQIIVDNASDTQLDVINMGYQPGVMIDGIEAGFLLYEPFMMAHDNCLVSADGMAFIELPVGCLVSADA